MAAAFTLLAALLGIAFAALVLIARAAVQHKIRMRHVPYSTALGVFVGTAFLLSRSAELTSVSDYSADPAGVAVTLAMVLAVSVMASVGGWTLATRFSEGSQQPLLPLRALVIIMLAAAAAMACAVLLSTEVAIRTHWRVTAAIVIVLGLAGLARRAARDSLMGLVWMTGAGSALALAVPLILLQSAARGGSSPRPRLPETAPVKRVVLLTVDTLRRDALGSYTAGGTDSPGIDALAKDSVVFSRAYSAGPWTVPAFASMFTGLDAAKHGVNTNFATLPTQNRTLAEAMSQAGYRTAAFGRQVQLERMGRGFDEYRLGPQRPAVHPDTTGGRVILRLLRSREWDDAAVTEEAVRWLQKHRTENFFLWVHWIAPHAPYAPPRSYLPVSPAIAKFGSAFADENASVHGGRRIRTPAERDWLRLLYRGEVRYVDQLLGRVLTELRDLGLYDESLVIFTSDHGEEFWDHGRWEHGHSLYDELVSVPLFLKLPHSTSTTRVMQSVSTSSLFSTIVDICGVPGSADANRSRSLTRSWAAPPVPAEPVYLGGVEYFEPRAGVVFDDYKYIASLVSTDAELYDLKGDAQERRSLINEQPAAGARGRLLLDEHRKRSGSGNPTTRDSDVLSPEVEEQLRSLGYVE